MRNVDRANQIMRVAWECDELGIDAAALDWVDDRVGVQLRVIEDVDALADRLGVPPEEPGRPSGSNYVRSGKGAHIFSGRRHREKAEPPPLPACPHRVRPGSACGTCHPIGDWDAVAVNEWAKGGVPA